METWQQNHNHDKKLKKQQPNVFDLFVFYVFWCCSVWCFFHICVLCLRICCPLFSVLLSFHGCVFGFVLLLSFRFVVLFYFAVGAVCFVNVFSTCAPLYCLNTRSCLCGYAGSQEALCACVHVCACACTSISLGFIAVPGAMLPVWLVLTNCWIYIKPFKKRKRTRKVVTSLHQVCLCGHMHFHRCSLGR